MGSKGIKRRKTRYPLPPVHIQAVSDCDEPPIMWPSAGSGFEADPFSPAGSAQREWFLARRFGRSRAGKAVAWIALAVIVVPLIWVAVSSILGH